MKIASKKGAKVKEIKVTRKFIDELTESDFKLLKRIALALYRELKEYKNEEKAEKNRQDEIERSKY